MTIGIFLALAIFLYGLLRLVMLFGGNSRFSWWENLLNAVYGFAGYAAVWVAGAHHKQVRASVNKAGKFVERQPGLALLIAFWVAIITILLIAIVDGLKVLRQRRRKKEE